MSHLLAFDAGTGSIRAVLFDLHGNQIAVSQKEWIHKSDLRYPGSMNFDVVENWKLVQECTKEVLQKATLLPLLFLLLALQVCEKDLFYMIKMGKKYGRVQMLMGASVEVSELKEIRSHLEKDLYTKSGQTFH